MFKNIGKKIKTLAVVIFAIEMCVVIFSGIAAIGGSFAIPGTRSTAAIGGIAAAAGIWGIGFLTSWISSFFLYGFGELIDKTAENAENTKKLIELMQTQQSQQFVQTPVPPATPVQPVSSSPFDDYSSVTPINVNTAENICPVCRFVNPKDNIFCSSCGAKLK